MKIQPAMAVGTLPLKPSPPTALANLKTASSNHAKPGEKSELRETFDTFVGEVFFGQMLGAMRKTVGKPAYFHGGRAEEIFQGQLDQMLAEKLATSSASQFTGPMFDLFNLPRS